MPDVVDCPACLENLANLVLVLLFEEGAVTIPPLLELMARDRFFAVTTDRTADGLVISVEEIDELQARADRN